VAETVMRIQQTVADSYPEDFMDNLLTMNIPMISERGVPFKVKVLSELIKDLINSHTKYDSDLQEELFDESKALSEVVEVLLNCL
jgi:hypothetical protein